MYVYTRIYIYIYVYIIYMYTPIYMYIHIHIYIYTPPLANSAMMSTPTAHCQLEDETVVHEGEDWPLAPNVPRLRK